MTVLVAKVGLVLSPIGIVAGVGLLIYGYSGHAEISGLVKFALHAGIVLTIPGVVITEKVAYRGTSKEELSRRERDIVPTQLRRMLRALVWFGMLHFIGLFVAILAALAGLIDHVPQHFDVVAFGGFMIALFSGVISHWYCLSYTAEHQVRTSPH